jgi:siroheme synthase-like protein
MSDTPVWYPVLLDLREKRCLVVGGGHVGMRKVEGLLAAGAVIRWVSIVFSAAAERLAETAGIECVMRAYETSDLDGVWFVVTALDDRSATARVHADARAAGVFMNAADDPPNCSVILPAVHRDGEVIVAVSTGGSSPAVAGWLRDRIASDLADLPGRLAEAVGEVRTRVRRYRSSEGLPWRELADAFAGEIAGGNAVPVGTTSGETSIADRWLETRCIPAACGSCTSRCRARLS